MRHAFVLLSLAVALGAAVACSTKTGAEDPGADAGDPSTLPPDPNPLPPSQEGPAGTGGNTGLPCDVQAVLENRCIACHDGVQQIALLSYPNLIAPSKSDPAKTLAQLSLERMKSTTSPMPPPPAEGPNPDEIAIFQDWVNAGTPKNPNSCTNAVTTPDGGTPTTDAGDGGGTSTVVCTSNTTWKNGNQKSPLMNPGMACNACHQKMGGPNLAFAGTVYATLHEPDLCNGKAPPPTLQVVVTDKNNKQIPMNVNAAGNFYITARQAGRVTAPFTAVVKDTTNNKTRAMIGKVTSGDCNSCHTVQGANGAPGRIQAP